RSLRVEERSIHKSRFAVVPAKHSKQERRPVGPPFLFFGSTGALASAIFEMWTRFTMHRSCRTFGQRVLTGKSACTTYFFHLNTGLRAAVVSSRRPTRVECGAVFTSSGVVAASSAIERIASTNRSHSCFDSDSVGSIIIAPGTMSGNAVVYG